ncbi:NUDIX domain-containing protein [Bacillus sp. FJAT-49705]|uniref:NUDIX domain-containing protein n=1 Tax=Cytobacillus citreus TaxID=2833586 RepID=A0ABS5NQN3_9BACI|nr:NUDIX domain-containing protein [Cytobacillus citreus]MBS4189779.1 NUDIX domain-containing protein [Cytobacillus citreus]
MVDRVNIQAFIYTSNQRTTFLLLKRTLEKGGFWQPVSGGIEKDEQPTHAVKREIFEETGINEIVQITDLQFTYTFNATKDNIKMKMKDICYGVEVLSLKPVSLSLEHSMYKWCTKEEAEGYLEWEYSRLAFKKLLSYIDIKSDQPEISG